MFMILKKYSKFKIFTNLKKNHEGTFTSMPLIAPTPRFTPNFKACSNLPLRR